MPIVFYRMVKRLGAYNGVKDVIISEGGAYFKDYLVNGTIDDAHRNQYFQDCLQALVRAKQEGVKVKGYFA